MLAGAGDASALAMNCLTNIKCMQFARARFGALTSALAGRHLSCEVQTRSGASNRSETIHHDCHLPCSHACRPCSAAVAVGLPPGCGLGSSPRLGWLSLRPGAQQGCAGCDAAGERRAPATAAGAGAGAACCSATQLSLPAQILLPGWPPVTDAALATACSLTTTDRWVRFTLPGPPRGPPSPAVPCSSGPSAASRLVAD